jgi:hypothetical protein
MKINILFATILLFWMPAICTSLQAQTSGTISLHSDYTDNMSENWSINTGVNKTVKITYSVDVEGDCDYITIYDVNSAGSKTVLTTLTGSQSGTIFTTSKSGKAEIDFTSDVNMSYKDGYTGFDIQYAVDERTEFSGLNVTEDAYIKGNFYTAGKLGIGTSAPQATLDTRGNAYISGLAGIGSVPVFGNKLYVYNETGHTAFRAVTNESKTTPIYGIYSSGQNPSSGSAYGLYTQAYTNSGSAYGLYSSVSSGSSSKKWAGYFSGGTVAIDGGKLHLTGSVTTANATDAGRITFWDDARTTVTDSIIPNLLKSPYSMPNYGIAAVPTTGAVDLWLAGYSGIRMFTGGNATP